MKFFVYLVGPHSSPQWKEWLMILWLFDVFGFAVSDAMMDRFELEIFENLKELH